jgi:hypothetical protein
VAIKDPFPAAGLVTFAQHLYFLLLAQKKVPKKKAVFPAAPTTCGDCAVFDRFGCVFCSIPSFFVLSKKALPPASGPSPPVGRASQTARQSQWWVCGMAWCLFFFRLPGINQFEQE